MGCVAAVVVVDAVVMVPKAALRACYVVGSSSELLSSSWSILGALGLESISSLVVSRRVNCKSARISLFILLSLS